MSAGDHIERAAEEVLAHGARDALGALALDVLSRQAEGRTLFAGEKFVEARALAHEVTRAMAELPSGNLLTILERGPMSPHERDLVAAFAVFGLGEVVLTSLKGEDTLSRFVGHADWFATTTSYEIHPFVDAVLDPDVAALVWAAVGDAVVGQTDGSAAARAHTAARLCALAASPSPEAEAQLHRIAEHAADPVARASALAHGGRVSAVGEPVSLAGVEGRAPRGGALGFLRLVTGVAALQWLGRLLAASLGLRREVEVTVADEGLRLARRVKLLGRVVREQRDSHAWSALAGAGRDAAYPALHLLVGALGLALGILLGGLLLFEGAKSGETTLLLLAAVAILAGAGFDLGLAVLLPGRRGTVSVDIRLLKRRSLRLTRVPLEVADRFLDALAGRLPRPR